MLLLSKPLEPLFLPFSFPLPLPPLLGLGQEGEGPLEGTTIPAVVGAEAAAVVEGPST
jgi:hypothetical protein